MRSTPRRRPMADTHDRRGFLTRAAAGAVTLLLGGCYDLSQKPWVLDLLGEVERLTRRAQRLFAGSHALAPEFAKADIAPTFRANGTLNPGSANYQTHAANGFRDCRRTVGGAGEGGTAGRVQDGQGDRGY